MNAAVQELRSRASSTSGGGRLAPPDPDPLFLWSAWPSTSGGGLSSWAAAEVGDEAITTFGGTSGYGLEWLLVDSGHDEARALPVAASAGETAAWLIGELRVVSGLTWELLAKVCGVSRRAVHLWASGRPMSVDRQEHVARVLEAVRLLDTGSPGGTRSLLLSSAPGGGLLIDALAAGRLESALSGCIPKQIRERPHPRGLGPGARQARRPRPPAELVDAAQDTAHAEPAEVRRARSSRSRGGHAGAR